MAGAAAVVAVADLSGEEGGRVEPSRLRKEWAGSFLLAQSQMLVRDECVGGCWGGRWAPSEALVGSPAAGGVVCPARVARCWAARALTFALAAGPRRRRCPPEGGAAEEEVVSVAVEGGDTITSLVLVMPLLVVTDREACPPHSSTFLRITSKLVNSSPIFAADI